MTSYQEYKNYHYLFKIENYLVRILSKPIKDIIFNYKGNQNSIMFLENNEVKCRMQLREKTLQMDMYDKKLNKWSERKINFPFNFTTSNNVGIGTTFPNVGIETTIPHLGITIAPTTNIGINLTP
jgi:hypothetical protein